MTGSVLVRVHSASTKRAKAASWLRIYSRLALQASNSDTVSSFLSSRCFGALFAIVHGAQLAVVVTGTCSWKSRVLLVVSKLPPRQDKGVNTVEEDSVY